jgi:ribosomal protein S18 acetylase RimI-like enzyme
MIIERTCPSLDVSGAAASETATSLEKPMIRATEASDIPDILSLAVSSGLFPPEGTDELARIVSDSLSGELGPDHLWFMDFAKDEAVGVAYCAPERLTEGTWNLYMLAIHPDVQRQGRGTALVRQVERELASRGARILLIETSGLGTYDRTRAFYRALGYDEEARIRDFYSQGDDKVVFRKGL